MNISVPTGQGTFLCGLLLTSMACTEPTGPPDCDSTDDASCFRGVYRSLTGARVADVETCAPELDGIDCVVSDENGSWKMPGLPLDSDVVLTSTHADSVPALFPQTTTMDWYDWYKTPIPNWIMESHASRLGVELDPDRGHLLFIAWEGLNIDGIDTDPVEGVQATLCPEVDLLFYANSVGLVSEDATATSSLGQGGVINLEPGVYEISLDSPDGPCTEQMFHWEMTEEGTIPVPIRAGFTTAIDVMCPAP